MDTRFLTASPYTPSFIAVLQYEYYCKGASCYIRYPANSYSPCHHPYRCVDQLTLYLRMGHPAISGNLLTAIAPATAPIDVWTN